MSAVLHEAAWRRRYEPNRLPAGVLAVAVHGVFFALLYFGFSWHRMPLDAVSVDLWQDLPESLEAPLQQAVMEEVVQPAQPVQIDQPDIELPGDQKPVPSPDGGVETKRENRQDDKKAAAKPVEMKPAGQKLADEERELLLEQQQAELERAEQAAAKGRVISEYTDKIKSKIKNKIVMPPGVRESALAVFRVTLLPGGAVLDVEMKKSSGNRAYDDAVERAIIKSDPLPLPPDAAMFKDFRVLELKFQPDQAKE